MVRILAALVLIGPGAAFAGADVEVIDTIDPSVSHVESGGQWQDRERRGHYRAVTHKRCSPEHCYDTLAVEWIATDSGRMKIVATKMVSELGDLTAITDVRFVLSKKGTRLQVKHEVSSEDRWTRCLSLGAPGNYSFKDGTCGKAG